MPLEKAAFVYQPQFSTAQVCEFTGVSQGTLQNWLARGVVYELDHAPIEGAGGRGLRRRFSFAAVMYIAAMKKFVDLGASVDRAASLSASFAHWGEGDAGWVGEDPEPLSERVPGLPYHHSRGATWVVQTDEKRVVVFSAQDGQFLDAVPGGLGAPWVGGILAVNVLALFVEVASRAGLIPFDVLDEVYGA